MAMEETKRAVVPEGGPFRNMGRRQLPSSPRPRKPMALSAWRHLRRSTRSGDPRPAQTSVARPPLLLRPLARGCRLLAICDGSRGVLLLLLLLLSGLDGRSSEGEARAVPDGKKQT